MIRRLVAVAPFVACAALYASAMSGYFLSDDMAVIFVLHGWQEKAHLWNQLFHKFAAGLDAQSHYYRPLPFLSYGLNLAAGPLEPQQWHLVNLAGHLLAGAAVYRICSALRGELHADGGGHWVPSFAAALFLLCGTSAEAVAWISGRYDVFATAFLLWAGALYLRARAPLDAYASGAWLCGILALLSKESAAVVPVLIACLAWIKHRQLPFVSRWQAIVRDLLPWIVLISGYFALRFAMFGSMVQVYPGTHPLERIRDGSWLPSAGVARGWLATALPGDEALKTAALALVALGLLALLNVARQPLLWRPFIGMIAATLASIALLLPHLAGFPANGEGGRLLYTTTALAAIALAIGLSRIAPRGAKIRRLSIAVTGATLVVANAMLLGAALRSWETAGAQMRALVGELGRVPQQIRPDGYAFVVAPDAIGAAPFARNANGAMVLPPIQREWLLKNEIVFRPTELPTLPTLLNEQLIPTLRHMTLNEAGDQLKKEFAQEGTGMLLPSDLFCWDTSQSSLRRVVLPDPLSSIPDQWTADVRASLRRAGCSYVTEF
jgi:hypothetical protein